MSTSTWQRRAGAAWLVTLLAQGMGLFSALAPRAAFAGGDAPKLVVVPFLVGEGAEPEQAERFARLAREELQSREDVVQVVTWTGEAARKAPAPAAGGKADTSAATAQQGLELIQAGQDALAELRFEDAIEKLKGGIDKVLSAPGYAVFDKVKEAWVSLAQASFRTQDDRGTKDALTALARMDPAYELEEGRVREVFSGELEKARKRLAKQGKGEVVVDGPPGSTAFIDGRELGLVPARTEVALGMHYVRVDGPSGERFGQPLDLKGKEGKVWAQFSGRASALESPATADGGPFPSPVLDENAVFRVAQLCKSLGARYALVGLVYQSGTAQLTANTALFSVQKQGFAVLKPQPFDAALLTANVDAYKLGEQVAEAVTQFPAPSPPQSLAGKARVAVSDAPVEIEAKLATRESGKPAPLPTPRQAGPDARKVYPSTSPYETGPLPPRDTSATVDEGGAAWWVWALLGVGVAGAVGGTVYGVSQATRPVTGTVTATW
jgi:hypothetical protein